VLQEAQACGIPVISTIHNGIPDGVLDGESAFLVPEKDVEALAERLQYLIENPQKWAEMGRIGRDFVEKKYDTKIVNQNLLQIYQQLSSTPNGLVIPGEADNGHKIST
jgi:colanic acid/amylovoran biosynthesis glycosyltransferase